MIPEIFSSYSALSLRAFRAFVALAFAATATGELWAEAAVDLEESSAQNVDSEFIVSEKDEVELVKDSNVSEAIQRPDLSFSNVTIDGEGSRQSLDSISAEDVTSVEVLKAVTPDQDADSRGGSIRLKTRPSYTQEDFYQNNAGERIPLIR